MGIFGPHFLQWIVILNFKQVIFKSACSEEGIFLTISYVIAGVNFNKKIRAFW